jgi:hypothetical protein
MKKKLGLPYYRLDASGQNPNLWDINVNSWKPADPKTFEKIQDWMQRYYLGDTDTENLLVECASILVASKRARQRDAERWNSKKGPPGNSQRNDNRPRGDRHDYTRQNHPASNTKSGGASRGGNVNGLPTNSAAQSPHEGSFGMPSAGMTALLKADQGKGLESMCIEKLWMGSQHTSGDFLTTEDFVGFKPSKLPATNLELILPEQQSSIIVMMAPLIPPPQINGLPQTPDGHSSFISNTNQSYRSDESFRASQNTLSTERTSFSRMTSFFPRWRRSSSSSQSWRRQSLDNRA